jgi:hypothetical protein
MTRQELLMSLSRLFDESAESQRILQDQNPFSQSTWDLCECGDAAYRPGCCPSCLRLVAETLRSSADVERVAELIAKRWLFHDAVAVNIIVEDDDGGEFPHPMTPEQFKAEILQALQGESKGEGR